MSDWIIVPVLLPAVVAALIVLTARYDPILQRRISIVAAVLNLVVAVALLAVVAQGSPVSYRLGDWPAPFAIVLVLDRLAALMLVLTALLGLTVGVYAADEEDRNGPHFHALLHFQLMGLNGAFLTGDLFNLFVFFEILLIASYGLMLHGGGRERLKNGFHYVAINLVGSLLFLFAVGLIYAVTGTLNMADLAIKTGLVATDDEALLRLGGIILLSVFALKAALVPFHFWLPGTYRRASGSAAAMFAIMTKVGAYAAIRTGSLIFGPDGGAAAQLFEPWLLWGGLLTAAFGFAAMPGLRTLGGLVAFALIGSTGTIFIGIALGQADGLAASLYYLLQSTLASAALFILVDQLIRWRGMPDDRIERGPAVTSGLVAACFFMLAITVVGLPPLPGFIGKLLILRASLNSAEWVPILAVMILGSGLALVAMTSAGVRVFWQSQGRGAPATSPATRPPLEAGPLFAVGVLMAGLLALSVAAGPVVRFLSETASEVRTPSLYVDAVLGTHVRSTERAP